MRSSAPRTVKNLQNDISNRSMETPSQQGLQSRYGVITAIEKDTYQVKVRLYTQEGEPGYKIPFYIPLINQLEEIHLLWGELRKGLAVRVWFRGKEQKMKNPVAEIIGNEEHDFIKQKKKSNMLGTGPTNIFSGGMAG